MLYKAAILCWVGDSVSCTRFLQYCQTFPLQMRLHVAILLSIRHFYTPSMDDLKQPDLTSGLYERVYTHTVFQHCEP